MENLPPIEFIILLLLSTISFFISIAAIKQSLILKDQLEAIRKEIKDWKTQIDALSERLDADKIAKHKKQIDEDEILRLEANEIGRQL